jgi:hypothetical protein
MKVMPLEVFKFLLSKVRIALVPNVTRDLYLGRPVFRSWQGVVLCQ